MTNPRYETPEIDTLRTYKGQRYEMGETVRHVCRDGRLTYLAEWWSHCADCGAPFSFYVPLKAKRFEPNRRCKSHRAPGRKVRT